MPVRHTTRRRPGGAGRDLAEKVAISLPAGLLADLERYRKTTGETRSGLVRRAVERLLERATEADMVREYVEGYRRTPETADEIAGAAYLDPKAAEETPWE